MTVAGPARQTGNLRGCDPQRCSDHVKKVDLKDTHARSISAYLV